MSREREELLALVRHADDPTQADEERVLRALQAAAAAGAGARAPGRRGAEGKPPAQSAALALKLGALGSVLAGAVAGVLLLRANLERGASKVESALAPRAEQHAPEGGSTSPRTEQRAPEAGSASPRAEQRAPEGASTSPRIEQRAPEAGSASPRAEQLLPEAGLAVPSPRPAAEARESLRAPRPAGAVRRAPARSTRAGGALPVEIALLERVQGALRRGDGAAALRELDAHRTADRVLLAERQAARILALCLVGELVEARRAARVFASQHPDSPQRAAIESSCANSRRIEEP
jgi:hypothetical protein